MKVADWRETHSDRIKRGKALAKHKKLLGDLAIEMYETLLEAYANLKGLDVPGECYEAEINTRLRQMIEKFEAKAGINALPKT